MPINMFRRNKIRIQAKPQVKEKSGKSFFKGWLTKIIQGVKKLLIPDYNRKNKTTVQLKSYKAKEVPDVDNKIPYNKSKNIKDNTYQSMEGDLYEGFDDYMLSKKHEHTEDLESKRADANIENKVDKGVDETNTSNIYKGRNNQYEDIDLEDIDPIYEDIDDLNNKRTSKRSESTGTKIDKDTDNTNKDIYSKVEKRRRGKLESRTDKNIYNKTAEGIYNHFEDVQPARKHADIDKNIYNKTAEGVYNHFEDVQPARKHTDNIYNKLLPDEVNSHNEKAPPVPDRIINSNTQKTKAKRPLAAKSKDDLEN